MATATYVSTGNRIDYTPDAAVDAGDVVVQGTLVGIATDDIAASALGSLAIEGIFKFKKEEITIAVGTDVFWDTNSNLAFQEGATGTYLGKAVLAAAVTDGFVNVKLAIADGDESSTGTGTGTGVA